MKTGLRFDSRTRRSPLVDAVSRFLLRRERLLPRLDELLQQAADADEVAWILCEHAGRELNLADCVLYLPAGDDTLVQAAAWGPWRGAGRMPEARLRLSIGRGVVGDCARLLRTQRVDDTRLDTRYVHTGGLGLSELATASATTSSCSGCSTARQWTPPSMTRVTSRPSKRSRRVARRTCGGSATRRSQAPAHAGAEYVFSRYRQGIPVRLRSRFSWVLLTDKEDTNHATFHEMGRHRPGHPPARQ
jgi:putative methionine-R-sulfoxide reductase with GAF domain